MSNQLTKGKTMQTYNISNNKNSESFTRDFANESDARHWIINTLDLSMEWTISKCEDQTKSEKVKALKNHLDLNDEEVNQMTFDGYQFNLGNKSYFVLTDDEAEEKAKDYIRDSVWAFNPSFLASHAKDGVEENVFKSLSELCESSNDAVLSLIDDFDDFVGDAISSDGRGHFISQYDGEESIEEINGTEYFIYRTN